VLSRPIDLHAIFISIGNFLVAVVVAVQNFVHFLQWACGRGCYTADIVSLQTRLAGVYEELGSANLDALPLSLLLSHPVLQEVISACTTYKAVVSYSSASSENYRLLKRWHGRRRITGCAVAPALC